jgi:PAS domain S-box-containing protein
VIRHLPVAAVVVEARSGRTVEMNARARQMMGPPRGRKHVAKPEPGWEIFHADGRPYRIQELVRSIRSGEDLVDEECFTLRADGSRLTLRCSSAPIYDNGEIVAGLLVMDDITERRRAEDELRAANERTEGILESITDEFTAFDANWRCRYVNGRALSAINGSLGVQLTQEEVLGRHVRDLFPDFAQSPIYSELDEARREGRELRFEPYLNRDDRWVEAAAYPWEGGLSIYRLEIAARTQADEQLAYHAQLLENMQDAVLATDDEFVLTAWNRGAEELFGWTPVEALGRPVYELIPTELSDEELARQLRDLTATGRWRRELTFYDRAGAPVVAEGRAVALKAADGSTNGYLCIMRDISERRRSARELARRARQQAGIAGLGLKALKGEDLGALMDDAVRLVCHTLEIEYAAIDDLLPGGEELLTSAGAGWREGVVGSKREPSRRGSLAGYTLLVGEPVIVDDLAAETRFPIPDVVRDHQVMSAATVVIDPRDKAFGTLAALSSGRRSFSEDDINFLQAIANVIATAVEREETDKARARVQSAERSRIARDLRDEALRDLTQAVAGVSRAHAEASDPNTAQAIYQAGSTLGLVDQQLRTAIYDLRLAEEAHKPFPELLESLVALHRTLVTDYDIQLEMPQEEIGSLGENGTQLLRIVGEALTNARRHSGATTVRVTLRTLPGQVMVEVSDDGVGFEPPAHPVGSPGTGIRGMRERAAMLNAELTISSERGTGSRVRVQLPFAKQREESARPVRVLVVTDHAAIRQALATALEHADELEVAGQAGSLAEARQMLQDTDVDVAVIELGLPDGYGGDLIDDLREAKPNAQALVFGADLDRAQVARAVESGAAGVINETAGLDEVVGWVHRLRAGETLLPLDEVVELLRFAARQRQKEHDDREAIAQLTAREREVLQALADGLDSQGIADRLHITIHTERNHVNNILSKLGLHSRLQALVFALRYKVVEIGEGGTNSGAADQRDEGPGPARV